MTDSTTTTVDPTVFEYGGRKRKGDKPAFAKFARTIVFADLPAESQAFVIRYGITQYTTDGMNTADNDSEAMAAVDARIGKLADADFSRERGEPGATDDPEVLANAIAREEVGAAIKAKQAADKAFVISKEQRAAAVTAYRAAHAERLVKEASKRIADRKSNGAAFDLDALLNPAA